MSTQRNTVLIALLGLTLWACGGDDNDQGTGPAIGDCPAPTTQVAGTSDTCQLQGGAGSPITTNLTLTADRRWLLKGGVFIGDDANETVLTVEPGTTVFGDTSALSFLTVRRGSKIVAQGTKDKPIVFTSAKAAGSRARGDWGGLILNGRASINACDPGSVAVGGCEAEGEGSTGKYGGTDDDDSSGVLRYVRIEFAGKLITSKNELNGLALQGVGRGTTLEYIQVHMGADDGIEFFGGTASFKHVLCTGISDDNLDWTDGWRGKGQFFVAQQYDDEGDNGIEADNNAENNTWTPRSQPMLSNLTLIGSGSTKSDIGVLLREGTAGTLANLVLTNWADACVSVNGDETYVNAWDAGSSALSGELTLTSSIIGCATPAMECETSGGDATCNAQPPFTVADFIGALNQGNQQTDPLLIAPTDVAAPDYRPAAGSPALSGAQVPSDPFFEQVSFIGGVGPDDDWTAGWTTHARN